MLVISTYIDKSQINGLGLFAGQDIKEGDVMWYLDPSIDQIIPAEQFTKMLELLDNEQQDRFKKWSYQRHGDYVLCADNTKFANHSETPNCKAERLYDVALRDIKKGEELTYNYRDFDEESQNKKDKLYDEGREKTGEEVGET